MLPRVLVNIKANMKVFNRDNLSSCLLIYEGFACIVGLNAVLFKHGSIVSDVYSKEISMVNKHIRSFSKHFGEFSLYYVGTLIFPFRKMYQLFDERREMERLKEREIELQRYIDEERGAGRD